MHIDNAVESAFVGIIGKECCRQRVGRLRSLSIGLGKKIQHDNPRLPDGFYGEWEIGTYIAAWRITKDGKIVCGSQDVVDSLTELDQKLNTIRLGKISEICMISKFDVRVKFENGISIDFLGAGSEEDELFHIFGPNELYVEYSINNGWAITQAK